MTRKEYESIYGVSPVIQSASALDDTPAPVRMTRAEYNERYGIKEPESGGILGPAKEAATGLGTLYGGGEQGIAMKLKADIEAGAKDIEEGKILKGVAKAGLRTAGDIASLIFAPIGAAIQATGFNKLTDYLGEKIAETAPLEAITDIPMVQNFALTHPNAEEDFNRALMLMLAGLDRNKIEPSTIIPRTLRQVKGIIGEPPDGGGGGTGLRALPTKLSNMRNARAIEKTAEEIAQIENNYSATRKANLFTKDSEASRRRIAQTDALADAVDVEGTIRTRQPGGAVEKYRAATIEGSENIVRESLKKEGATVNIGEVAKTLTAQVYRSGLEGADLVRAVNGLQKELQGLNLRADELGNIELYKIHDAKISTTQNINYKTDSTPTIKFRKAKARSYKTIVENKSNVQVTVGEKTYGIPEINAELGKYYEDISRLEALDGKKVKGGRLGKYAAQVTGNIAGGAVGGAIGGPIGIGVGTVIGGETARFVQGKTMARTFGEQTGRAGERNPILERARAESQLPKRVNLKVSDTVIGAPKDVPKTKEILKTERDIAKNVEQQRAAIKKGDFTLVATLKQIYQVLISYLKDLVKKARENPKNAGFIRIGGGEPKAGKGLGKEKGENRPSDRFTIDAELSQTLRGAKGLTADQIMQKFPDINLKREVRITDVSGVKHTIPEGEALTPYELKGNKILLQDGGTYIVSKNQFQNIKGQSVSAEAKEFAPELKGLEESVRGEVQLKFDDNSNMYGVEGTEISIEKKGKEYNVYDAGSLEKTVPTLKEAKKVATEISKDNYNLAPITKFSQYQLPGGKNYKEILIKAPENIPEGGFKVFNTKTNSFNILDKDGNILKPNVPANFQSSHWNEPNVISHLRLNERTYKGQKVTFMEEAQSDWMRTLRTEAKEKQEQDLKDVEEAVKMGVQNGLRDGTIISKIRKAQTGAEALQILAESGYGAKAGGGDIAEFKSFFPDVDITTPQGRQQYLRWSSQVAATKKEPKDATGVAPSRAADQLTFLRDTAASALTLAGASGRSGARRTFESWFVGSTNYTKLEALTNTLRTNVLTLMTDPDIKKFFGPQMSEADVRLMTAAGTTLNPELQGPKQMTAEIKRLDNLLNRMQTAVSSGLQGGANIITAPDGTQIELID